MRVGIGVGRDKQETMEFVWRFHGLELSATTTLTCRTCNAVPRPSPGAGRSAAYIAKAGSERVEVIGSFYDNVIEGLHVHQRGRVDLPGARTALCRVSIGARAD